MILVHNLSALRPLCIFLLLIKVPETLRSQKRKIIDKLTKYKFNVYMNLYMEFIFTL